MLYGRMMFKTVQDFAESNWQFCKEKQLSLLDFM